MTCFVVVNREAELPPNSVCRTDIHLWSKPFGYHPNDMIEFLKKMIWIHECFAVGQSGVRRIDAVTMKPLRQTTRSFIEPSTI